MKIFDSDGVVMEVLGKLADIIFMNFTFVLLSLPIFTIGASVTAMYDCSFSLLNDQEDVFLPRQFWKSFCRNFKRSTGAWMISLAAILFFAAYAWVIRFFDGSLGQMYKVTLFVLLFLFFIGFQYVFPLIAQTNRKVKEIWKLSWKLAVVALPWSIANMAAIIGMTLFFTLAIPANTSIYLWAFLFFGLITYISSRILQIVFLKHLNLEYERTV